MESLIHPSFSSGSDNPNAKLFYYLLNDRVLMNRKQVPKPFEKFTGHYGIESKLADWMEKCEDVKCSSEDLEKLKNKVYNFDNCAYGTIIDVSNVIESEYDGHFENLNLVFKEPIEKCDCGYMADEKGICTECNLPKSFRNTEQVELNEKEQIIKWITQRIKDEQRKHSSHDENWQEIAARKIYASYDINLKK